MSDDPRSRAGAARRRGAVVFGLGMLGYCVAIVLFVAVYGRPAGSGPGGAATLADRMAHYLSRQLIAQTMWRIETLATVLVAIGGFSLAYRATSEPTSRNSAASAWTAVGVGAVLLSLMYPIMLGGYPAAADAGDALLFEALNSIATFQFELGNSVMFLGLAGVFLAERRPAGALPPWLGSVGALVGLLAGGVGLLAVSGVEFVSAETGAPFGLLAFLLAAWLGYALSRAPVHPQSSS
jgi:hypothetical protein